MSEVAVGFWFVGVCCKMKVEAGDAFKFYWLLWSIYETELALDLRE